MSQQELKAADQVKSLSERKAELLKLMLESKSRGAQEVRSSFRPSAGPFQTAASWGQQRLWFIDQFEGGNRAYHIMVVVRLRGALNQQAVHGALETIVQRHEILRTRVLSINGEPVQQIESAARFDLQIVDLRKLPPSEIEAHVTQQKAAEIHERFDLSRAPLIRGRLLFLSNDESVLLITMHHIVSDGWSIGIFLREFDELYRTLINGNVSALLPLSAQYADFSQWQREWFTGNQLERQLMYWRSLLAGAPPELELPKDRARPIAQSYNGANIPVILQPELCAQVKALARDHGMTLFMVLYACWTILLSRLSGQDDVVVGIPIANRQRPEFENLIGLFANTLVLRVRPERQLCLRDFFARVKDVTLAAYEHQDLPFEKLVEALQPERNPNRNPIFQVAFALQNAPKTQLNLPGLTSSIEQPGDEPAMFDLLLSLEEHENEIRGIANYATDLFNADTIQRWIDCYVALLSEMLRGQGTVLGHLNMLPKKQHDVLVEQFNRTDVSFPQDEQIHQLFERQVHIAPNAVALSYEAEEMTYAELNRRANRLARYLLAEGAATDDIIGLCMDRGLDMIVGILGILKAGSAYLPLDPAYPSERLSYMLKDSGVSLVLTHRRAVGSLPVTTAKLLSMEHIPATFLFHDERDSPAVSSRSQHNLAYVIYTSGSTGNAKAVMLEHRGLVALAQAQANLLRLDARSRVLQFSSLSFDACTWEWVMALTQGASLCLAPRLGLMPGEPLTSTLVRKRITHVLLPPIALSELSPDADFELDTLFVGGDVCPPALPRVWAHKRRFINAYGPTEITVAASLYECNGEEKVFVPIGRPIENTKIYILDQECRPVPVGVRGEIFINSCGIARGYLGRPEMTAERFIADPFSLQPGARMYRTGDLGRWLPDGTVEYLGRNDHQVKLRGFRIELGEIESHLSNHHLVKDTIVILREDSPGDIQLVAYFVPKFPPDIDTCIAADVLRAYLKRLLPEHMIPGAFVMLDQLPLTENGKLDRKRLPAPDRLDQPMRAREAPIGDVEVMIGQIWQELLRVSHVGRNDNFFELGGHSLLATRVIARIRDAIHVEIPLRAIFDAPTVRDLSACVVAHGTAKDGRENGLESLETVGVGVSPDEMCDEEVMAEIAELRSRLESDRA